MRYLFLFITILFICGCSNKEKNCNIDKGVTKKISYVPDNLDIIWDFEKGLECANKSKNENILVLFTRYGQSTTPPIEWEFLKSFETIKFINKNYIFICLIVDDPEPLPNKDLYYSEYLNRQARNYGNKWTDFQIETTNTNFQPVFVKFKKNKMVSYHSEIDKEKFLKFIIKK